MGSRCASRVVSFAARARPDVSGMSVNAGADREESATGKEHPPSSSEESSPCCAARL